MGSVDGMGTGLGEVTHFFLCCDVRDAHYDMCVMCNFKVWPVLRFMLCVGIPANVQTVNADGTLKDLSAEEQQQMEDMQAALLENLRKSGELQFSCALQQHITVKGRCSCPLHVQCYRQVCGTQLHAQPGRSPMLHVPSQAAPADVLFT
jgi:hypothetical protein